MADQQPAGERLGCGVIAGSQHHTHPERTVAAPRRVQAVDPSHHAVGYGDAPVGDSSPTQGNVAARRTRAFYRAYRPTRGGHGSARSSRGRLRLLVISSCPEIWGGSEELWWAGVAELLGRGHRVDVLRLVVDPLHARIVELASLGGRVSALSVRGERLCLVISGFAPRSWRIDERRRVALAAAVEIGRRRPDVVVISQGQSYDGLLFAYVCRRMGVRYMLISQKASETYWPHDEARERMRRAHEGARVSLFVSEHNRRVTEDQLGPLGNARVVRNPVLLGHDGPYPWPETDRPRMACVARLHVREKGQDLLLRVLAGARWQERRYELTFFGSGHDEIGLRALTARLGLADRVHFAGCTDDVQAVWRSHSLLVLPSRTEGMPLALVEAMMCGRPAVVTDVGGNAEVIEDGATGFVAAGAELGALDQALERAWQRRDDWAEMGRRAASHIRLLVPGGPRDAGVRLADLAEAAAR